MFKVICIREPKKNEIFSGSTTIVIVGNIYTVKKVLENTAVLKLFGCTGVFYELYEHLEYAYHSELFALISDIDEVELVNNREEEVVEL